MIDMFSLIILLILIAVGGTMVCIGVFFIPVGGAPAAMGTAVGLATGAEMLAAPAGVLGLLMTAAMHITPNPTLLILVNGGISSAIMLTVTYLAANLFLVYGKGIPLALGTVERDPVTKEYIKPYVTPGTVGHGVPTAAYISGTIGGFIIGVGGALTATIIYRLSVGLTSLSEILGMSPPIPIQLHIPEMGLASLAALAMYLISANISAYSIRGVIEGWWDPKFKKFLPKTAVVCFIASLVFAVAALLVVSHF